MSSASSRGGRHLQQGTGGVVDPKDHAAALRLCRQGKLRRVAVDLKGLPLHLIFHGEGHVLPTVGPIDVGEVDLFPGCVDVVLSDISALFILEGISPHVLVQLVPLRYGDLIGRQDTVLDGVPLVAIPQVPFHPLPDPSENRLPGLGVGPQHHAPQAHRRQQDPRHPVEDPVGRPGLTVHPAGQAGQLSPISRGEGVRRRGLRQAVQEGLLGSLGGLAQRFLRDHSSPSSRHRISSRCFARWPSL